VIVLIAMSLLTRDVLASEKTRVEAESRADLEERTRLALWRMDAVGAVIVSNENRRAPSDYNKDSTVTKIESLKNPLFENHFELREGNQITTLYEISTKGKFSELQKILRENPLVKDEWSTVKKAIGNKEKTLPQSPKIVPLKKEIKGDARKNRSSSENRKDLSYQSNFNASEKRQRAKTVEETIDNVASDIAVSSAPKANLAESKSSVKNEDNEVARASEIEQITEITSMRAVWIGDHLFLLRQLNVMMSGVTEKKIQGVWVNSSAVKNRLLSEVRDLLPDADLVKVDGVIQDPLALVSLPFQLQKNEIIPIAESSIGKPLLVGWTAVLLALITASLLVHNVMQLSERRASFVSAVTHELRTPLTTFRLYSDMLESDAVKPEKRGDYLRVLSREADRLSHLVENVLSFSQIERGSARSAICKIAISDLLEPMRERLEARLETPGLILKMDLVTEAAAKIVKVDSAAVEHILFNLIDNAAKYATSSDPNIVKIEIIADERMRQIIVSDHGPGISLSEQKRIFRAFHKSAREAAESKPGVGLGLALSRRLA
jgi:signal transduction histidine kinase